MENYSAKLCDIDLIKFPLVKAIFKVKELYYKGYMMIDTGSETCSLNKEVLGLIDPNDFVEGDTYNLIGLQGQSVSCKGVKLSFSMARQPFTETFYVNEAIDFNDLLPRIPLIGIIGAKFLKKHRLVLDYVQKTLHSSTGDLPAKDMEAYDYIYPMDAGMEAYRLPIACLVGKGVDLPLVVDSGANNSVITQHVLDISGINHVPVEGDWGVTGASNKQTVASVSEVWFPLASVGGTKEQPKIYEADDTVQVLHTSDYVLNAPFDNQGNQLMPICGLLSSSFLLKHRWVIDFGAEAIYRLKNTSEEA